MTTIPADLLRGYLLKVVWVDIYEDATGDPDKAKLAQRTSYGLFWGRGDSHGLPVIVTTTTIDEAPGQNGFCIYPEAVVRELVVVKKVRRPRRAKVTFVVSA
jgi:hypothetical protein